ncbi:MAG: hypothetical protein ACE362_08330 [Phaeodactylibacter xiamenensis]|uniref:hypothetical protein n=1 Tax=Phaeodactylibacter xiamenensis TaxID=1524460 RepID=UPI00069639A4|nr:hypothetical protein [Phaeodactylibacter xiamenensis]
MQNRYVGDIGDFGKYLLLKNLCSNDLQLGVNWCLVEDETHNNDGKQVDYLQSESGVFFESDADLFRKLKEIVSSQNRSVSHLQDIHVLPLKTLFFSEKIPKNIGRFHWHDDSLKALEACDVIFYDPDNGIEVQSYGKLHPKAIKYVYFDEIRDAYRAGKSIIIYQHANRGSNVKEQIKVRIKQLTECLDITDTCVRIVYSRQGIIRFYLIVRQSKHAKTIDKNLNYIKKNNAHQILRIYP